MSASAKTLGFIVHGTQADRVNVPPVILFLGVNLGIAINLTGGGENIACVVRACHSQGVMRAQSARFHGLDGEIGIAEG